ncbi:MAG: helix-turn-helix domain-containing protein [Pseudomonadota bacterium]
MEDEHDATEQDAPDLLETNTAGVGDRLRSAREARCMDLKEIADQTRIPSRHLSAIEAGDFAALPSRTYAIGFSRSFARAVGLDETSIADAVREELADNAARASASASGMEPGDSAKLPSAGLARFALVAALILAAGLIAFFTSYFNAGETLPPIIAQETQTAPPAIAQTEMAATQDAPEAAVAGPDGAVVFTALEDGIWVRFYEDGGDRLFEDTMEVGESFELPGDTVDPRINTGRPDAFAITIGGAQVPKLAETPVTMGDAAVSAEALLSRETPQAPPITGD